jgi:hypothetical protein
MVTIHQKNIFVFQIIDELMEFFSIDFLNEEEKRVFHIPVYIG